MVFEVCRLRVLNSLVGFLVFISAQICSAGPEPFTVDPDRLRIVLVPRLEQIHLELDERPIGRYKDSIFCEDYLVRTIGKAKRDHEMLIFDSKAECTKALTAVEGS